MGVLFSVESVGRVTGIELANGQRIVVKEHQARWTAPFLEAVVRVQAAVAAAGFPCPVPLAGPLPIGERLVTIESYLPDPGQAPVVPEMLAVSARGLAEVMSITAEIGEPALADSPLRTRPGRLYPEPHSPVFDFEATNDGAGWIDELATAARAVRDADASPPVVMHGDWSARNVRLGADRVLAAYDWDSLFLGPESVGLGIAAATWSALGVAGEPPAPSAEEVGRYIAEYEAARGSALTPAQRRAARGSALYGLAYTARCEHAIDPAGEQHLRARTRLRIEGPALLDP